MNFYKATIIEATQCTDEQAKEIETIMREDIFHSTLDWQTRAQLKRAARQAMQILKQEGR